jgi:hypothetical protein
MRRVNVARMLTVVAVVVGTAGVGVTMASATKPDPEHKVTICHATASRTNPYVAITVDIASIVNESGHGSSGINAGDIIRPFDIDGNAYPGNNWDAEHQAILERGCDAETTTTTLPPI